MRRHAWCMVCLVLAGCDGMVSEMASDLDSGDEGHDGAVEGQPGTDAGTMDAGLEVDGGIVDSGIRDSGTVDDAGEPDAGMPDAGMHDAGTFVDAGTHDAGLIDAGPPDSRQTPYVIHSTDAGNGFYEYLPPGYGDGVPRPLMVFWHGVGENGVGDGGLQDLHLVLANGPPKLINNNTWSNALPFVVLSPQHRGAGTCPDNTEISNFISWAIAHYDVDLKRLYLTGLSCGAIGSWQYVAANLDTVIAAAVLISGDPGDPTQSYSAWGHNMCNLGQLPIWSFHGDMDPTVNIADDENTMNLLIACPMPPRKDDIFTVYPGAGHDVWTRTYDLSAGHDIYTWLLQQSKP